MDYAARMIDGKVAHELVLSPSEMMRMAPWMVAAIDDELTTDPLADAPDGTPCPVRVGPGDLCSFHEAQWNREDGMDA